MFRVISPNDAFLPPSCLISEEPSSENHTIQFSFISSSHSFTRSLTKPRFMAHSCRFESGFTLGFAHMICAVISKRILRLTDLRPAIHDLLHLQGHLSPLAYEKHLTIVRAPGHPAARAPRGTQA